MKIYEICFTIIIYMPIIDTYTCGHSNIEPIIPSNLKIINGTEARPHSWPWIVTLQHPIIGHFCGGSLIDANYVVSAAHCFFNVFFDSSIVYIGNHYLTDRVEQRTIREIIRHPSYNLSDGNPNDIVLLKLNESVNIITYPIICLPTTETMTLELPGQSGIVAGWGLTSQGLLSNVLLQTRLNILHSSIPECQPYINDTYKQLCIGVIGGGTGSCSGDSGGPLMAKYANEYYLIGIVSAGIGGCGNSSSLYIRARAFVDWICETDPNIAYCSSMTTFTSSASTTSTVITSLPSRPSTTTIIANNNNKRTTILVATLVPALIGIIVAIIVGLYFHKRILKRRLLNTDIPMNATRSSRDN